MSEEPSAFCTAGVWSWADEFAFWPCSLRDPPTAPFLCELQFHPGFGYCCPKGHFQPLLCLPVTVAWIPAANRILERISLAAWTCFCQLCFQPGSVTVSGSLLCCLCGCTGSSGSKEQGAKERKNRMVLLEEVLVHTSLKWMRNLECKQWNKLVMYFMWYFFTKSVAWSYRVVFNVFWEWTRLCKVVQPCLQEGLKISLTFKNCSFTEAFSLLVW